MSQYENTMGLCILSVLDVYVDDRCEISHEETDGALPR